MLISFSAWAQIPVNFDFCTGTGTLCVTPSDSTYELCLKFMPGYCESKDYEIDWGDNKVQKITLTTETTVKHVYDLRNFSKNCNQIYARFNLNIGNVKASCLNDNKGYLLTFIKRPEAKPVVQDACVGNTVSIRNNTCPLTSDIDFLWEFSDGRKSTDVNPSFSFTDPNQTYKVKLTATSESCGSTTAETEFKLGKPPVAAFNVSGTTVINQDTVVCLSGGGILELDGSVSEDEERYSWAVNGGRSTYSEGRSSDGKVKIKLTEAKVYTVSLTVSNKCGSKMIVRRYRVLDVAGVAITPQPDVCREITYKIPNPVAGATYTLNNAPINATDQVSLKFSATPYIVTATINNTCGTQTASDTFLVSRSQAVRIVSPAKDTLVCAGTDAISLKADIDGGLWSGSGVGSGAAGKVFLPGAAGTFEITYARGQGECVAADTLKVTVQGTQASAVSQTICEGTPYVILKASPAGGAWTTTACADCIKGDTLRNTSLTATFIDVRYVVTTGAGCKAETTSRVTIGSPNADFLMNSGCVGTAVKPANSSSGADSYAWFVNGKEASGLASPELALSAGKHQIMLIARAGLCADTIRKEIEISSAPAPVAFSPSEQSGCAPLKVGFEIAGNPVAGLDYAWNLGDGRTYEGFQLPDQVFENSSKAEVSYNVTLTASNGCGQEIATQKISVRPLARAEIGVDSTVVRCTPAKLLFSNRSSGHEKALSRWFFDDGTILQSGSDTVSHLFSAKDSVRTYRIKLEVTSACGRDTAQLPVKVYPSTVKALYAMSKSEVCPDEAVQFTDGTVPKPDRWIWRFGDGTVSTLANPVHAFSGSEKEYKVTLIAYTGCGSDSTQLTVRTTKTPKASFEVQPLACEGSAVYIANKSDEQLRFVWDFGDGSETDSISFSPEHTYLANGSYTITASPYRGSRACKGSPESAIVTVVSPAKASFGFAGDSVFCAPGPVSILNRSEEADNYFWSFSDGQTASVQNPALAFEPGSYTVKLVTSKGGTCLDSTERAAAFVVRRCDVEIPQAFTPNGDGRGDRYTLFGNGLRQIGSLKIRNRWGEVVFDVKDVPVGSQLPGESWDGTFNGKDMPADMYVYEAEVIYVDNRRSDKLRGNIYLQR